MNETEKAYELKAEEDRLRGKYSILTKFFLLLGIIIIIWAIVVILGVIIWEYAYNWAVLSLTDWILVTGIILLFFIILDLVFYLHFSSIQKKRKDAEKPKPEFINGKRIYVFTYPRNIVNGVFSKTYIPIDEHNVLRLRTLMIPPNEMKTE